MKYLIIDTSTKYLCVAIACDGKVLRSYNRIHDRDHSRLLIPVIEKILKQVGVTVSCLDFLAVDRGPGSFTGLRIGVAAIKGLSLGLEKPVIGFSSLDVLAYQAIKNQVDYICPIIDAKRSQVYSSIYRNIKGEIIQESDYTLATIDKVLGTIKGSVAFTGDAVPLYQDTIKSKIKKSVVFVEEKAWFPTPRAAVRLCEDMYRDKKIIKAEKLSPLYLYADECTVNKKQGAGKRV